MISATIKPMSRRNDDTYPITDAWRTQVREELQRRGRGSQNALARQIGCASGTLADVLSDASRFSHLVPAIHSALGWPPPVPPIVSRDYHEISSKLAYLEVDELRTIEATIDMLLAAKARNKS